MQVTPDRNVDEIINDILNSGYKEFPPGPFDRAARAFQKRFVDEDGERKYFITIYMHEAFKHPYSGFVYGPSFELHTQLYGRENHDAVDLLFHSSWDIKGVETLLDTIFRTGVFDRYDDRD